MKKTTHVLDSLKMCNKNIASIKEYLKKKSTESLITGKTDVDNLNHLRNHDSVTEAMILGTTNQSLDKIKSIEDDTLESVFLNDLPKFIANVESTLISKEQDIKDFIKENKDYIWQYESEFDELCTALDNIIKSLENIQNNCINIKSILDIIK